jgi:uroporphyrinogen-III synthase
MRRVRLLVTRPEPDGERTAAALRERGHEALLAPLLRVDVIREAEIGPGPWSALIFTSANAVRAVEAHPRGRELSGLRVFAVGRRTKAAAQAAGFSGVVEGGGDVRALARSIAQWAHRDSAPLLYLAGDDRSGDLAGDLAADDLAVHTVEVYRAVKAREFPRPVLAALAAGGIDGVLHFSRRTAEAYLDCAHRAGLRENDIAHYCLSPQVATPILAAGARYVRIAERPEESALLALIELPV